MRPQIPVLDRSGFFGSLIGHLRLINKSTLAAPLRLPQMGPRPGRPAVGRPSVMEESMSIGRQRVLQRASIEWDKRQCQHAANQLTSWIERASRAEAKVLEQNHSSDPDASAPLHEDS